MPVSLTPKLVDQGKKQREENLTGNTVEKYMTRRVITVLMDTPIYDAIDTLIKLGISGMPVVDEAGHLVGMLSEADCLPILSKRAYHQAQAGKVGEYMSTARKTVSPDMELMDIIPLFTEHSYRRLPVLTKTGKLVGQISRRDVLIAIQQHHRTSGA